MYVLTLEEIQAVRVASAVADKVASFICVRYAISQLFRFVLNVVEAVPVSDAIGGYEYEDLFLNLIYTKIAMIAITTPAIRYCVFLFIEGYNTVQYFYTGAKTNTLGFTPGGGPLPATHVPVPCNGRV